MSWREAGGEWRDGAPLWRVEKDAHRSAKGGGSVTVPESEALFAGSLLMLQPATSYEIRLTLSDPNGAGKEVMLKAITTSEPVEPKDQTVLHVIPGDGGGTGSEGDPFKGLRQAQKASKPGVTFLLHPGLYAGGMEIRKGGEAGKPVIWRALKKGEAIIDGKGTPNEKARLLDADNTQHVWIEDLVIRNGNKGVTGNGASNLVVRGCHIHNVEYGINGSLNEKDTMHGWFIADNFVEGPSTWPRTKGIENARGIQVTGEGHEICYNRIRAFADAINTFSSTRCVGIDIHHNEISECTDDGIELDESERNVRCFQNRLTNVFQGISVQPVHGGPIYILRNALYNVEHEPFKMHNNPSGALFLHNTVVKKGTPFFVYTTVPVRNCLTRNNLFVGTGGGFAFEFTAQMQPDCDFDYDGVTGGPWKTFMRWNDTRYPDAAEVRKDAAVWRHVIELPSPDLFGSGTLQPQDGKQVLPAADLRLKPGGPAADIGLPLVGINEGFKGKAPDLGAYEEGEPLPHYGPREGR